MGTGHCAQGVTACPLENGGQTDHTPDCRQERQGRVGQGAEASKRKEAKQKGIKGKEVN